MPDKLRVTVIMPVRNEAASVDATLEAIFQQTRLPDEIVVADGCSTDGTAERALRHANRGIPLRVVTNEAITCGGGRNAATRAATHDVLVTMDFGNRAKPDWLAAMVRPFESDPALDLLGGVHYPMGETRFERVGTAVVNLLMCRLPTMEEAEVRALIPDDFTPGGMCMAFRRRAWERAGGFSEWARKGQDGLFGQRVRRMGGKVDYTLDAVVYHHAPGSFRELFDRHFYYAVWNGRMALERGSHHRAAVIYGMGLLLAGAAIAWPWLFLPWVVGVAGYVYYGAWQKLREMGRLTGEGARLRDLGLAAGVLVVRDVATLLGGLIGAVDRKLRPRWRRKTDAYLDQGEGAYVSPSPDLSGALS